MLLQLNVHPTRDADLLAPYRIGSDPPLTMRSYIDLSVVASRGARFPPDVRTPPPAWTVDIGRRAAPLHRLYDQRQPQMWRAGSMPTAEPWAAPMATPIVAMLMSRGRVPTGRPCVCEASFARHRFRCVGRKREANADDGCAAQIFPYRRGTVEPIHLGHCPNI